MPVRVTLSITQLHPMWHILKLCRSLDALALLKWISRRERPAPYPLQALMCFQKQLEKSKQARQYTGLNLPVTLSLLQKETFLQALPWKMLQAETPLQ
nr:MAG TPA: hypothetical protein [Caudoviricetes sp.]